MADLNSSVTISNPSASFSRREISALPAWISGDSIFPPVSLIWSSILLKALSGLAPPIRRTPL